MEGTAIWSSLVLHTTHRSLSGDSEDRVYSSGVTRERAISHPLGAVPLHSCFSNFFLIFITVPPFCTSHPLLFSCPCLLMRGTCSFHSLGQGNLLKLLTRSPWVSRARTRCSEMCLGLLSVQMQFEIAVLLMLMAAFQGRS